MYEVQSIVNKRTNPETNLPEYFVKWVGFPSEQNTWEPEKNLKFVRNLIDQFNERSELKGQIMDQTSTRQEYKQLRKSKAPTNSDDQQNLQIFQEEQSQNQNNQNREEEEKDNQQREQIKSSKQSNQKIQLADNERKQAKTSKQSSLKNMITESKISPQAYKNKLLPKRNSVQREIQNDQKNQLSRSKQNVLQKIQSGKRVPPPMPPDFSINRSKYIDPYSAPTKLSFVPQKHKIIEKQKFKGNQMRSKPQINQPKKPQSGNSYHNLMNGSIHRGQQMNRQLLMKNNSNFKPQSKIIPPPPLPRLSQTMHNYHPSQSHPNGYRAPRPQETPNSYHNVPSFSNHPPKDIYPQKHYPSPRYKYENMGHNHHTYLQQTQQYNLGGVGQVYDNNGYSYQGGLVVYQILNMQKNQNGYIYFASTNEGSCWLNREDIVPRFSTQLVEFYERYLTFQQ